MLVLLGAAAHEQSDREFMVQLFHDYNRLMFATAKRYVSDQSVCEDIVQDSLEKLMKKIRVLRPMERCVLAGYIVSTIRNTSFTYLKRQGRAAKHQHSLEEELAGELPSPSPPLDEMMILADRKAQLSEIWPRLPLEDRVLLEGKYILGYTDQELALQLGCKPDSIRMKLTRARRRAWNILTAMEGDLCDKA